MSTPQIYRITELAGAWIAGYRRPNSETITLTPEEAEYDVRVGTLVPVGVVPTDPVPPPLVLQEGDYLHFLHAGRDRYAVITALEDFLNRNGGALGLLQAALTGHAARTDNPHGTTKAQVGLGNVANLAPADLPLSKAVITALAGKATPADIAAAIASLVNSAPAALDTLRELADALGDDPNFAATVTNILAGKQPLDDDLTAIAGLGTTPFGRSLLNLASLAAVAVTPTGGTPTTLGAILSALDPTAPDFQAAQSRLYAAWAAALPAWSGVGPAPVPAGQPFLNNGTVQIAQ